MVAVVILLIAVLLDSLLGDPRWLPHLIVGYGKMIALGEKALNRGAGRTLKGALLTIGLVALSAVCGYAIMQVFIPDQYKWLRILPGSLLLFYCLANRTLIEEGKAVFKASTLR